MSLARSDEAHQRPPQVVDDGLPPETTSGTLGSYTISIELVHDGFVLHGDPDRHLSKRVLTSFYGDQTGLITYAYSQRIHAA